MDLSLVIYVFLLFVSVPHVLLRTFPSNGVCDEGASCVYSHECPASSRNTQDLTQCQENKICCRGDLRDEESEPTLVLLDQRPATNHRVRHNHQVSRVTYMSPRAQSFLTLSPNMEYSVDQTSEGEEESRIVNVQLLNNTMDTPIVSYTKTTSSDFKEDNNIVFPEKSEEVIDDRIKYIKKLYQKYIVDFKKYNYSKKNAGDIPKRKLKHTVGYRSAKFCKLYEKYTVDESLLAIPLLPSLFPVLMQKNHCSKPLPLIVGGINATKGEFPHMAGLGYDRGEWIDFLCGGSLISERYVLTAGHCGLTKWGPPIIVRLGTRNLITDVGQNMDVEQVIVHPDYKEPSCYNDIALVKMVPGLQMGSTMRPACLPQPDTSHGNPGSYLIATGWGRTGYGLFSSPNLQKVSLEVINNRSCDQMFLGGRRSERLPNGILSSMLCAAGYLDSSHDTCQGDSGGPLQTLSRHSKCMYEVIGITSFGKLCGTGLPAIYTRISTFIPWIEDIVWPS